MKLLFNPGHVLGNLSVIVRGASQPTVLASDADGHGPDPPGAGTQPGAQ